MYSQRPMPHTAYIALGSNIEPRAATLIQALSMLDETPRLAVRQVSQMIVTAPVGGPPGQGPYLNAAARLETDLDPHELLAVLLDVEARLGRDRAREERWGSRTCDLDLLLFDDVVLQSPDLCLPHPRMHERIFVLRPLVEIAPKAVHPVLHQSVLDLLDELYDQGER